MIRRPQLALVPAHAVRPLVRRPPPRTLAVAAAVLSVLGLLYLAARESSLFAVERLEISGVPAEVRAEVERAAERYVGESLVALDTGELRRLLEALPSVRALDYDRAFPHTLRIVVAPEVPAALVRSGPDRWLVSKRGRVIRALEPGNAGALPRIRLRGRRVLAPGDSVDDREARLALRALVALPQDFAVPVRSARSREGTITIVLESETELRLGDPSSLALKLAVADRVLRRLPGDERGSLAYLDLTVPDRPVAAAEAQVST